MEFTFISAFLMNVPILLASYLVNLALTGALLYRKPDLQRAAVLLIPYILFVAIPATWLFIQDMGGYFGAFILETYLEVTGWALAMKHSYRVRWGSAFATAALTVFLYGTFQELTGFFLTGNYDLTVPGDLAAYMTGECIGVLVPAIFVVWFIIRSRLFEEYSGFLSEDSGGKTGKILLFLIPAARNLAVEISNEHMVLNNSNPMVSILLLLLIYGVFNYMFRCKMQDRKLKEQKLNLSQQKLYIQNLESVQKEVRLFRHDFKNMMAGASLQARDGNLTAVQEFISEVTGDFEQQVGRQIFQISQIGNIRLTELKGLLILKMTELQKKEIPFRLEVPFPFEHPGIPERELCRAAGILLDNAAEAAGLLEDGEVTTVFEEGEEVIRIMIRNPVIEEVPVSKIWKDGYSTKGEGRGTGLTSFQRIVERYENVASLTRQEDGYFIQELKIMKRGGKTYGSHLSL